jgi:hypothetical protein
VQLLSGCLKIVGAVDLDAEKIGRDAGELAGLSRDPSGVMVTADLSTILAATRRDCARHLLVAGSGRVPGRHDHPSRSARGFDL